MNCSSDSVDVPELNCLVFRCMLDDRLSARIAAHKIQLLGWREAGCYKTHILLSHYKCCDCTPKILVWRLRVPNNLGSLAGLHGQIYELNNMYLVDVHDLSTDRRCVPQNVHALRRMYEQGKS